MLTYIAFRALSVVVPLLPPRLGYALATALGDVGCWLSPRARRSVQANLRRVLGDGAGPAERAAVKSVFRTAALNYYDLFRVPRLDLRKLERALVVRGWEHVEQARQEGKGVILVGPHLGNLDVVGQIAVLRSVPCVVPTERLRSERLLNLVSAIRASRGLRIVPTDGRATAGRILVDALRRNELVGIIGDRNVQGNGMPVRFFGEVTDFPTGPVVLALRTGAPLLAGRAIRGRDRTFDIEITPPLELPRSGDFKNDVRLGTELLAAVLERFIREAPGQWIVFEPVWPAPTRHPEPTSALESDRHSKGAIA